MQRSLMLSLEMKRMAFEARFTVLYYYGNLCTATQSILREIYDFFSMQKSTQISFDDMESFS